MNIKFLIDYPCSQKKLPVNIILQDADHNILQQTQIDLQTKHTIVELLFDFPPTKYTNLTISFSTTELDIIHSPIVVKSIELDNFYSLSSITHSARREFTEEFLTYAKEKNIYLDLSTVNDNCLSFVGKLIYMFKWPFYRNIVHEK